jgi:hypothetical protein
MPGFPRRWERVRVYAKHQRVYPNGGLGQYDGIYPNWYEVVKSK